MTTPRFYCPLPLHPGERLALPDDLAHHAVRVLRLKPGQAIVLFNGNGGQYGASLEIEGRAAWATIGPKEHLEAELPVPVVLVQGLASGDKMDWIVEKAVEMGVSHLVPIAAQRSVIQLTGDRREKRLRHWQRIAVAASEQCGRNRLMDVSPPQRLEEWLTSKDSDHLCLVCHPEAGIELSTAVRDWNGPLALLVGPEGGWSDEELELMQAHALKTVRFGRRILRTETAAIALMGALAAIRQWE